MNMMSNDIRYTQQTEALNEIAGKFGVVTCRPDRSGSRNTVLFYTEEDVEHNHLVDQQPTRYRWKEADDIRRRDGTQIPAECIYRDCFWSFENSDTDDRFNLDYANKGKLDLRCPDWKERLEGHIGVALLRKRQFQYVRMSGGWGALREADEQYNSFNRSIIAYMKKAHGHLYLGNVNYYDEQREQILAGKGSVYEEYTGQEIYDFSYTFAVPTKDASLEEMIRSWNKGTLPLSTKQVDQITHRIDEIGGENFIWF